jgi:hypothetical protein
MSNGKGSQRRRCQIETKDFARRWDEAFGNSHSKEPSKKLVLRRADEKRKIVAMTLTHNH